ncbi:MAG: RuBisCO large subunit C-terminal-like domain-containing protein [Myxococcota bacterium]
MEFLRVTYELAVPLPEAESRAEGIAREQTVEVPRVVVRDAFIAEHVLGRVEQVAAAGEEGRSRATIAYPADATGLDPAQTLGVLFGNSSLAADVRCVDIEVPESLARALGGPRHGLEALRAATGAADRALTCTAVKPLGHRPEALADLLRAFGRAGIDVVKDDQGLANQAFCPFEARVRACLGAVEEVADATGHRVLYAPNLIGTPGRVFDELRLAEDLGARAVMASPMLIGLPTFSEICARSSVPVLAHPSHGGAVAYAPELLFGKLLRLYGADAVIFVGYGGRFETPRPACASIADGLRAPWAGLRPSLPVPGGGIELENAAEIVSFYGRDTMLLVGGSLQLDDAGPEARSRAFVQAVHDASAALPA